MLLMICTYKYIFHAGLQKEIQITFGKLLMLSAFCEVGGGFQYIENDVCRADLMQFLLVYANMYI